MTTDYQIGHIRAVTEYLDPETRRHVRHDPKVVLELAVGKSERIRDIELSRRELLRLNREIAHALEALGNA